VSVIALVAVALITVSPAHRVFAGSNPEATKSSAASSSTAQAASPVAHDKLRADFAALPLAFEENQGQADAQVKYMARGNGYKLFLTAREAVFKLHKQGGDSEVRQMMMNRRLGAAGVKAMLKRKTQEKERSRGGSAVAAVHMQMVGVAPNAKLSATDRQTAKVNYFIGNDPAKWHSGVPLFGQVSYQNIYPGIDLAFHGSGPQLEFDYRLNAGADAKAIALQFSGADKISTNAAGDLILGTGAGPLELHRPVAYQVRDGVREFVDARFTVAENRVSFALGPYDHNRELVIDPTVTYSTYFGGDFADYGSGIAADSNGNAYVVGSTDSDTLPGLSSATNNLSFDVFVTEISSTGALVFTSEFGGSADEFPGGIALDSSSNIYISGTTDSADFPVTTGAAQTTYLGGLTNGANDAFAVKLTAGGSAITWGTYIAGSDSDSGLAIAIDTASPPNVYVVGETFSNDLGGATGGVNPLPNGSAANLGTGSGADDGYIVKLNGTGSAYSLVSYLGGSNGDLATGVALDPSGNIYVAGETISSDVPVTSGVVQSQCGTDGTCNASGGNLFDDAFVYAIQANLSAYKYVTYYGGSGVDDALGIVSDASGDAYFTGNTSSTDLPTAGTPLQGTLGGAQNALIVELNPTGSAATYSTYFGGNGTDYGLGITLDYANNIYLTGQTSSTNLPVTAGAPQSTFGGSTDAFVATITPGHSPALLATYLGGSGDENQLGSAIALDGTDNIYLTGDTTSSNFPVTASPIDGTYNTTGQCVDSNMVTVPCPDAYVSSYGTVVPQFTISATTPSAVAPGSSGTSTVTLTALNGYASPVNLTCSVIGTGTPLPACGTFSPASPITPTNTTTLTITTTANSAAMVRPAKFFYAMWLPIAGLSLAGVGLGAPRGRSKKLFGFLMIGMVMAALCLMPACGGGGGGSGGGGGGGGTGGTPAGTYTVTITGAGTDAAAITHATTVTLTVN
jgi:hypothetical protein